jgi:formamidopyrimidine-DNA glycosylase
MPELPDILLYVDALERYAKGLSVRKVVIYRPFLVRSVEPPVSEIVEKRLERIGRIGKRLVLSFSDDLHLILHLMIAGRLHWQAALPPRPSKIHQAAIDFGDGALVLTEAGTERRASLHVVRGKAEFGEHDRGGIDPLSASAAEFEKALRSENHTLKRALTEPRLFDGIGNAYSDEILFAARLSPLRLSQSLSPEEMERLRLATAETLRLWIDKLKVEFACKFPGTGDVTAFRPDFLVHGKYRQACQVCGMPIQRIVYASNETNYCARCQNEDRVLADRALSRLLKEDWPRRIDDP